MTRTELAAEVTEAIRTLKELGVRPGARLYTGIQHVSSSGMTRHISCHIAGRGADRGRIFNITALACRVLGYRQAKDGGAIVGGCGMDMGFHLVYNLGRVMWPKGAAVKHSARRFQEERDGKTVEVDGGYLLKHEWL